MKRVLIVFVTSLVRAVHDNDANTEETAFDSLAHSVQLAHSVLDLLPPNTFLYFAHPDNSCI